MSPEEELQRAARAESILGDELFKEAVTEVEQSLINGIKRSPIKDAELREKLCQQLTQLDAVLSLLRTHMESGKLAEATLKQKLRKVVNWQRSISPTAPD